MNPLTPTSIANSRVVIEPTLSTAHLASLRKENIDLKSKCLHYEKAAAKSNLKATEIIKEYNHLKSCFESLTKELSILKLSNEKLLGDSLIKDTHFDQSKQYISKLEAKIVEITKAKKQSIVEQTAKLKKDNESLNREISNMTHRNSEYEHQVKEYKKEIEILHKALEVKTDNLKYKTDIKSSLFYDVGIIKQETDELRLMNDNLEKDNEKLKMENDKKKKLLQELSFDKTNLVEVISEMKSNESKTEQEIEIKDKKIKELINEKIGLSNQVEKLKEILFKKKKQDKYSIQIEDNKGNNNKRKALQISIKSNSDTNATNQRTTYMTTSPKSHLGTANEAVANNPHSDAQKIIKGYESKISIITNNYNELQLSNLHLRELNDGLVKQMNAIDKDKKALLESKEALSRSIEKATNELSTAKKDAEKNGSIQEDQINQLRAQISSKKNEIAAYKGQINDYGSQCEGLTLENNTLKEELHNLKLQIEKVKATNSLLHQNLANAVQCSESLIKSTEGLNPVLIGSVKVSETSMQSLIKKEKEKNKEYNDLINQYKKQIVE